MERRSEPRFPSNLAVEVTVLTDPPSRHAGRVVDLSGQGLRLALEASIPTGTPVKIETIDCLALAETSFCLKIGQGFMVGVRVDQVLGGLADLERLRRHLLNEQPLVENEPVHIVSISDQK
jgi:hypothetical protein